MADGGSHRVGLELLGKCSKEEAEKVRERNKFFRKFICNEISCDALFSFYFYYEK